MGVFASTALLTATVAGCGGGPSKSDSGKPSATSASDATGSSTPPSGDDSQTGSATSQSSSSTQIAAPQPVKGKPASVTVVASGDMINQPVLMREARKAGGGTGYSFANFLAPIKPFVSSGDIAICQMENPLSVDNTNLTLNDLNVPSFNAPHEMATDVKDVGFEGCSTANNHAFDRGLRGLQQTRQVMANAGLKASGPGASADQPGDPVFYEANGLKIAQLSYSYTLDNRFGDEKGAPSAAPWLTKNLYAARSADGIKQDAAAARKKGADIVIVSMHWGIEYANVSKDQRTYANDLLNSGQVDWIIGNHPHVVQTCQKINGRYVNYALGNTMGSQDPKYWLSKSGKHVDDGVLAKVTFKRDADGKITSTMTYQPTHQTWGDHVVQAATPTHHKDAYDRVNTIMKAGCDATPAS